MYNSFMEKINSPLIAVEASAGSGKTYSLASRYVNLVLKESSKDANFIKEILAITFTNKASIEMKKRIIKFLKGYALGESDDKKYADIACNILEVLFREYNYFQVRTIDSFINSLVCGSSMKLNMPPHFKIEDRIDEYMEYGFDKLLDKMIASDKVRKIFDDFLIQYIVLEQKENWFIRRDIVGLINSLFSMSYTYGCDFMKSGYDSKDIIVLRRKILDDMNNFFKILPEGINKKFKESVFKFLNNADDNFKIKSVKFLKREEIPINKGHVAPKDLENLWAELKASLRKLCEIESMSRFNSYIDLFDVINETINEISQKEEILFLSELNKKAKNIFDSGSISVNEVYLRLATRLKHYLIDEFQDTSILQWTNIAPMIEDALSRGGSLFYVGDKKQAIYRFRGGEILLFDEIKNIYRRYSPVVNVLDTNYRSQKEIVEFNNKVFSHENLKRFFSENYANIDDDKKVQFNQDDVNDMLAVFSNSKQKYKDENNKGYVHVEFLDEEDKEERHNLVKENLIFTICELNKRFEYGDIAVLLRVNHDVELITSWLIENKIPVCSEKTLNIKEHFVIKEIIALLKFLTKPLDNIYFTAFITGEIFLNETKIDKNDMLNFIFSVNSRSEGKGFCLYKEFQKSYKDIWLKYLSQLHKDVGTVPLYEFVIKILNIFNISSNFNMHQGFVMHFLEVIKKYEEKYNSILLFLEFFDNAPTNILYVNVSDSDAVRVLTIHEAKGLEFGAVILPFLSINPKVNSFVSMRQSDDENQRMKLIYLNRDYAMFSDKINEMYKEEYKKSLLDELAIAYVALTRAKNEMYVIVPEKVENSKNIMKELFGDIQKESGTKNKYPIIEDSRKKENIFKLTHDKVKQDWWFLIKDSFIDEDVIKAKDNILEGNIMHYIFSFISVINEGAEEEVIANAIGQAKLKFQHIVKFEKYEKILREVLKKDHIKGFFYPKNTCVYTEKEVVNDSGETRRIDRFIIQNDKIMILDYKNSFDDKLREGYLNQLAEYKKIIGNLYQDKKVEAYLLYLDTFKLEKI